MNNLSDGTTTVVSEILFEKGCQFGPLVAPKSQHVHPEAEFVFKLYDTNEYLDTSHEGLCNWMSLVSPATKSSEINLICYQVLVVFIFYFSNGILLSKYYLQFVLEVRLAMMLIMFKSQFQLK